MPPLADVRRVAQQHIEQQRGTHLPADGVGAVTEEVTELECLLHLFEEHFDVPAGTVEPRRLAGAEIDCEARAARRAKSP